MSELRTSRPPVPPMSGDADATPAKPKASATAKPRAKAAVAKPKVVPARTNAKGEKVRCAVLLNANTQCSNPARHLHAKAYTCSTHDRSIRAGVKLNLRGKATLPYVAPHAVPAAR